MDDYIVFTVSGNYYALRVASIQRIIQVPAVTLIPNAHPFVEGMMSYEKRVVKVVNFRAMTGQQPHEEDVSEGISGKSQKLLMYQNNENFFGIKVDQIEDIVSLDPSSLKQVDQTPSEGGFVEIEGVAELGEKLVNVIKSVTLPTKEKQ
ncbi:MAG TPA: chemotaxis protein CheW [Sulfuricurvum sp.]|nr:chemotaxis protein CheW [Sulfuricurvum sp.]